MYVERKKVAKLSLIAATFGLLVALVYVSTLITSAYAQQSQVSTTVCDNQPPVITITQPFEGSTLATSTIAVQGSVERASSLTLQRNGATITTIPISFSSNFNIPLTLEEGSNVIELKAQFTCNDTDASELVTVQYEPSVTPPDPDPEQPGPGGGGTSPGDTGGGFIPGVPATGIGPIIDRIKDNLSGKPDGTTGEEYERSYVVLARSWLALALFIIALAILLLPKKYYNATLLAISKNSQYQTPIRRFVRLVAAILVIICIVVLQI